MELQVWNKLTEEALTLIGFLGIDNGSFRCVCIDAKGNIVGIPNTELTTKNPGTKVSINARKK